MHRAQLVLSQIAHQVLNDVFRASQLAFRQSALDTLSVRSAYAAPFRGPGGHGRLQLAVEDSVLAAASASEGERRDLLKELANMAAGRLEAEFLTRGVAVEYGTPVWVCEPHLTTFARGTHGIVCFFDSRVGRVALGIELNLAPGVELEASSTRPLPRGLPKLNLPEGTLRCGSVLVVDDSSSVRAALADALSSAGFQVLQAESGSAALAMLHAQHDVAMIFTDLHMDGMQGAELVRMLKADPLLAHIPIVAVTAGPAALAAVDSAHIVTCLVKPLYLAGVVSLTQRVIAKAS